MIISRVHPADIIEVDELDTTERGRAGFGHSGIT
jgi:dUTPase